MGSSFFSLPDQAAWLEAVSTHMRGALQETTRAGRALFAVAGGKTPQPILEALSAAAVDWDRLDVIPTDERLAPEGDPARNIDFIRRCLAGAIERGARVHSLEAAQNAGLSRPNIVLLGMGADGHIASLFPGAARVEAALDPFSGPETCEIMPDPLPPEAPFKRLSLTMFALACASEIVLAATGEAKKAAIEAARTADPKHHPLAALLYQNRAPVRIYWAP